MLAIFYQTYSPVITVITSIYKSFYQALNMCPYELAIPDLKLESENKWLELIKKSKDSNKENKIK